MSSPSNPQADEWQVKYPVEGGAQGKCAVVNRASSPQTLRFRKILKDDIDSERRHRFFVEATLFTDLEVHGVPRIVETNADKHKEKGVSLYYVAEYIAGERLDRFGRGRPLDESSTLGLFRQLLAILTKIHRMEVVHRDLKPQNIVISQDELFLVDFGIAYHAGNDCETKQGQELGNRFLRLPEHSAGSLNKRDVRSDVTQAVAVALYCLTRAIPRVLVDERGRYPHQRPETAAIVGQLQHSALWNGIFDRAFQQNIDRRWSSAADLLKILDAMTNDATELEKARAILRTHGQVVQKDALAQARQQLNDARVNVEDAVAAIIDKQAVGFRTEKQGWVLNLGDTQTRSEFRAYPIGEQRHLLIKITVTYTGSQMVGVIATQGESREVHRAPPGDPPSPDLGPAVEALLLPMLSRFLGSDVAGPAGMDSPPSVTSTTVEGR